MKKFFSEFKEFIAQGNVMNMAVGVIIGAAFKAIVDSLVNDILMPIIGSIFGGLDFTALTIKVGDASIAYGNFIQNIINFVIVAFYLFVMIKALNKMHRQKEEEAPAKADDILLLEEIRDLLKNK